MLSVYSIFTMVLGLVVNFLDQVVRRNRTPDTDRCGEQRTQDAGGIAKQLASVKAERCEQDQEEKAFSLVFHSGLLWGPSWQCQGRVGSSIA